MDVAANKGEERSFSRISQLTEAGGRRPRLDSRFGNPGKSSQRPVVQKQKQKRQRHQHRLREQPEGKANRQDQVAPTNACFRT